MSVNDHRTEPTTQLFEVKQGATEFSSTFIFGNEDHTLGNVLRYILVNRPETEFCGYSVPHPYEPKMNVRLQCHEETASPSLEVLKNGFRDLEEIANIMDDKFTDALQNFKLNPPKEKSKKPNKHKNEM
eukprot:gene10994-14768_t